MCDKTYSFSCRIRLKNCGHIFCERCIAIDVYKNQWCDNFSTECVIKCPECEQEVCDNDWQKITSYLCDTETVRREIHYYNYVCMDDIVKYKLVLDKGEYMESNMFHVYFTYYGTSIVNNRELSRFYENILRKIDKFNPDIVYFPKYDHSCFEKRFLVFKFGDESIKKLRESLNHEITKYVFHPSRVKRFSEAYNLGGMGYLDAI
jgi:hypothetical protein